MFDIDLRRCSSIADYVTPCALIDVVAATRLFDTRAQCLKDAHASAQRWRSTGVIMRDARVRCRVAAREVMPMAAPRRLSCLMPLYAALLDAVDAYAAYAMPSIYAAAVLRAPMFYYDAMARHYAAAAARARPPMAHERARGRGTRADVECLAAAESVCVAQREARCAPTSITTRRVLRSY